MTSRNESMNCPRALELLEAWLDGEPLGAEKSFLEAHFAGCFACAEEMRHARFVRDALRGLPQIQCPEVLVEAAIAASTSSEPVRGGAATATAMACGRARALVEAYLDGAITRSRLARVQRHFDACNPCGNELAQAARVRDGLRALPQLRCPDSVMTAVLERIQSPRGRIVDIADRLAAWAGPAWRPALAAAGIAALAIGLGLLARSPGPADTPSRAEVARAELEVKWVLAYMGEISRRTGSTVREDVIGAQVVTPMTAALETAFASGRAPQIPTRPTNRSR